MKLIKYKSNPLDNDALSFFWDEHTYAIDWSGSVTGFASRDSKSGQVTVVVPVNSELGLLLESEEIAPVMYLSTETHDTSSLSVTLKGDKDGNKSKYVQLFHAGRIDT